MAVILHIEHLNLLVLFNRVSKFRLKHTNNYSITSKTNGCIITDLALFVKIDPSNRLVCGHTKKTNLMILPVNSIIYNYLTWCWYSNSTRPVIIQVC